MVKRLPNETLVRIGKADNSLLQAWREGCSLHERSGLSIDDLKLRVASDRLGLAYEHRRDGNKLLAMPKPPYRSVVSRYYYAMYHAMRAAAYVYHDGDDYESHAKLPLNIPDDFPTAGAWQSTLKNARLNRNSADYDPYPKTQNHWRVSAHVMKGTLAIF